MIPASFPGLNFVPANEEKVNWINPLADHGTRKVKKSAPFCNFVYTVNNWHLNFGVLSTVLVVSRIAVFFSIEQNYVATDQTNFACLEKEGMTSSLSLSLSFFFIPAVAFQ